MDSNYITIADNETSVVENDSISVEKKIEEYLLRTTPREGLPAISKRSIFLHHKGIMDSPPEPDVYNQSLIAGTVGQVAEKDRQDRDTLERFEYSEIHGDSCEPNQTLIDRYTKVVKENEHLKKELEKLEAELNAIGPRYKYMEKHFEDFIRMKEEYERLKEDKILEGKMIETKHKGQQTWSSSIICESCVKTLDIIQSADFQHYISCRRDDSYCVTKSELTELEEKFKTLKDSISEREREYENRFEKAEIIHLTALNCKYRAQLQEMHRKNKQNHNWATALQRIIAKICARDDLGDLNDQEQGWVERIVEKYLAAEETGDENLSRMQKSHQSMQGYETSPSENQH